MRSESGKEAVVFSTLWVPRVFKENGGLSKGLGEGAGC